MPQNYIYMKRYAVAIQIYKQKTKNSKHYSLKDIRRAININVCVRSLLLETFCIPKTAILLRFVVIMWSL